MHFSVFSQTDLENTLGEIASLGAAGVVLWGEMSFAKSKVSMLIIVILNTFLCMRNYLCIYVSWKINPGEYVLWYPLLRLDFCCEFSI